MMSWPTDVRQSNEQLLVELARAVDSGAAVLLRFAEIRTTKVDEWRLAFGRIDVGMPSALRSEAEEEMTLARSRVEVIPAAEFVARLRRSLDGMPFPCRDLKIGHELMSQLRS